MESGAKLCAPTVDGRGMNLSNEVCHVATYSSLLCYACSAMRYIVDPPKSPLKRGTLIYCTLLQHKALCIFDYIGYLLITA